MSGFTEHQASDAGETAERRPVVLNLRTARRMLPLVRRIVDDIMLQQRSLSILGPEQDRLDRHRRDLSWPERQRRYQVHEEFAAAQHYLQDALAELEVLGVALVEPDDGRVGLPTVVNGRLAFFSWQQGETTLQYWHFPGESQRRAIPANWNEVADVQLKMT
ncbi:MAG: DUF2203 family protein [Planctomycetia bacterium]|nr:DUF2203 family protein [Planctomycetia bacterium]